MSLSNIHHIQMTVKILLNVVSLK